MSTPILQRCPEGHEYYLIKGAVEECPYWTGRLTVNAAKRPYRKLTDGCLEVIADRYSWMEVLKGKSMTLFLCEKEREGTVKLRIKVEGRE